MKNWSLEDTVYCPTTTGQLIKARYWYNPTGGSPDYYNNCAGFSSVISTPENFLGYQFPKTGASYAGIAVFSSSNNREYVGVGLISTLNAGKKYCVSFYVSLVNESKYAIDAFGAYLSSDTIKSSTYNNLPYSPQIKNKIGVMLSDTLDWMLIGDTIIAQGNEKFLTIGNFNPDSTTIVSTVNTNGNAGFAYYYIDDVSVIPCDSGVGIRELTDKEKKIKLYPNPNDGNMQLDYTQKNKEEGKLIIYDFTGKTIREYVLDKGKNIFSANERTLQNGIYLYKVIINSKVVASDKLIIIR